MATLAPLIRSASSDERSRAIIGKGGGDSLFSVSTAVTPVPVSACYAGIAIAGLSIADLVTTGFDIAGLVITDLPITRLVIAMLDITDIVISMLL